MRKPRLAVVLTLVLLVLATLFPSGANAADNQLGGEVTGSGGRPLAQADVELYQFGVGRVAVTRTDTDGAFALHVPDTSAAYWVRVWATGYQVAESAWLGGGGSGHFLVVTPDPLIAQAQVRAVDARTGAAVAGATLELAQAGLGTLSAAGFATGATTFATHAGTGYVLRARSPGKLPVNVALPALIGGSTASFTLSLPAANATVSGQVASALDGTALVGATVQAVRTGYGVVATATAAPDGAFRFDLPVGAAYTLIAAASGESTVTTVPFTLASGTTKDFSGEQRLLLTPVVGDLAGRLLGSDGNPISGLTVQLQRKPFGTISTAATDSAGRFAFAGLYAAPGVQYRVQVAGGTTAPPGVAIASNGAASAWTELNLRQPVLLALQVPASSYNSYSSGGVTGSVVSAAGKPLGGAQVELWQDNVGLVATAAASSDGRFRFPSVLANRSASGYGPKSSGLYLKVTAPGYFASTLAGDGAFDVAPNQDTAVTATLYPQQAPLAGRVRDGDGNPLVATTVTLQALAGTAVLRTKTDADGRWSLASLDPLATYRIAAALDGYFAGVGADLTVDPAGIGARDLTLRPTTATLGGQVANADGEPVVGAHVTAWSPNSEQTSTTDDRGRYSLTVAAGQVYQLTAALDGAASGLTAKGDAAGILAPAPGDRPETAITLWPATGAVVGTITTADGDRAAAVGVDLVQEGRGVVAHATTDANGRFTFAKVAPGARYVLRTPDLTCGDADSLGLPALFEITPGRVHHVFTECRPG